MEISSTSSLNFLVEVWRSRSTVILCWMSGWASTVRFENSLTPPPGAGGSRDTRRRARTGQCSLSAMVWNLPPRRFSIAQPRGRVQNEDDATEDRRDDLRPLRPDGGEG